jgi:hypothetical protein
MKDAHSESIPFEAFYVPNPVIEQAREQAEADGRTVHVCRLPDSNAIFPFGVIGQSDFRFQREKWRELEVCAVTCYGRVIEA